MATISLADVRSAMAAWKDARGVSPLDNANYPGAEDRAGSILSNAAALLSMLSAAAEDMGTLGERGLNSEFGARTGRVMAAAFDGVGDLIGLASFLLED